MKNKMKLFVDQYGMLVYARTIKELRSKVEMGGCRVSKMFIDRNGEILHIGYVIGSHWFSAYLPLENKA